MREGKKRSELATGAQEKSSCRICTVSKPGGSICRPKTAGRCATTLTLQRTSAELSRAGATGVTGQTRGRASAHTRLSHACGSTKTRAPASSALIFTFYTNAEQKSVCETPAAKAAGSTCSSEPRVLSPGSTPSHRLILPSAY